MITNNNKKNFQDLLEDIRLSAYKYLENYNPSNGEVYSLIPDSGPEDINLAVEAAKEAFKSWSKTPKQKRSDILMKLADTIDKLLVKVLK